jgi:hypothetical protein
LSELSGRLHGVDRDRANEYLEEAIEMSRKLAAITDVYLWPLAFPATLSDDRKWQWDLFTSTRREHLETVTEEKEAIAISFLIAELLKAGWIDKALELTNMVERDDFGYRWGETRDEIYSFVASEWADQGRFEEAKKLAKGIWRAEASVKEKEFLSRIYERDLLGAQSIGEDIYKEYESASLSLLATGVILFASMEQLEVALVLLARIPDGWDYKPLITLSVVRHLSNMGHDDAARAIMSKIVDSKWKAFAQALISWREEGIDEQEKFRRGVQATSKALAVILSIHNEEVKLRYLQTVVADFARVERLQDIVAIVEEIPGQSNRLEAMVELADGLAGAGMLDDAFDLLSRIKDRRLEDQAINRILRELEDQEPELILEGIQNLLRFVRKRGREMASKFIAQIIPLIPRMAEAKTGVDVLWQTQELVVEAESWWGYRAKR